MKIILCVFLAMLIAVMSDPAYSLKEKDYQKAWCAKNNGEMEIRLKDGTRADCVTAKYAAEIDFAHKWAEGLGQVLRYARLTGKRGALVLICGSYADRVKAARAQTDINHYKLPIDIFPVDKR